MEGEIDMDTQRLLSIDKTEKLYTLFLLYTSFIFHSHPKHRHTTSFSHSQTILH